MTVSDSSRGPLTLRFTPPAAGTYILWADPYLDWISPAMITFTVTATDIQEGQAGTLSVQSTATTELLQKGVVPNGTSSETLGVNASSIGILTTGVGANAKVVTAASSSSHPGVKSTLTKVGFSPFQSRRPLVNQARANSKLGEMHRNHDFPEA